MSYEPGGIGCLTSDSRGPSFVYSTKDSPVEVLTPGYFPDDWSSNFMCPGDRLEITCWPECGRTTNLNPVMTVSGVMSRTQDGVWLFLMTHTPVWPEQATEDSVRAVLAALFPSKGVAA